MKKPRLAATPSGHGTNHSGGCSRLNILKPDSHCKIYKGVILNSEKILELNRGAGGIGCWTINRQFVQAFGVCTSFLLSDLICAYLWGDITDRNQGEFFIWHYTLFLKHTRWTAKEMGEHLNILAENDVLTLRREQDDFWFRLNFQRLYEIGGRKALREG